MSVSIQGLSVKKASCSASCLRSIVVDVVGSCMFALGARWACIRVS